MNVFVAVVADGYQIEQFFLGDPFGRTRDSLRVAAVVNLEGGSLSAALATSMGPDENPSAFPGPHGRAEIIVVSPPPLAILFFPLPLLFGILAFPAPLSFLRF
jgi:hypothetical protein